MTSLRGIAWNHTRSMVSVVATGQRFEELHPKVTIRWEKRSLQAFADASLAAALEELRKLQLSCDSDCLRRNPIRTAEWMCGVEDDPRAAYCPFAYGYSNYSRPGYSRHLLKAGGLVTLGGKRLRSTLGGAGMAISARTAHPRECMDYAAFTASPEIQRGIYFASGGQPGHRSAWTDARINEQSTNFFRDTLETLDEAILRPQHPGYMDFQNAAAPIAHAAVAGSMAVRTAADEIHELLIGTMA